MCPPTRENKEGMRIVLHNYFVKKEDKGTASLRPLDTSWLICYYCSYSTVTFGFLAMNGGYSSTLPIQLIHCAHQLSHLHFPYQPRSNRNPVTVRTLPPPWNTLHVTPNERTAQKEQCVPFPIVYAVQMVSIKAICWFDFPPLCNKVID